MKRKRRVNPPDEPLPPIPGLTTVRRIRGFFINLRAFKDAWVWCAGGDRWHFTYGKFFWKGRASGRREARRKGWSAYVTHQRMTEYADLE